VFQQRLVGAITERRQELLYQLPSSCRGAESDRKDGTESAQLNPAAQLDRVMPPMATRGLAVMARAARTPSRRPRIRILLRCRGEDRADGYVVRRTVRRAAKLTRTVSHTR